MTCKYDTQTAEARTHGATGRYIWRSIRRGAHVWMAQKADVARTYGAIGIQVMPTDRLESEYATQLTDKGMLQGSADLVEELRCE